VARHVETLPEHPQTDEEKLAQLAAACLAVTATDEDFEWMFDYKGAGEAQRSELVEMAEAELRGDGEVWQCSGTPLQSALRIITTPFGEPTP